MHLAKLRTVGGSVMFAIPKAILEGLDLAPDAQVGLSVDAGRLIVDPHPRPRYQLSDLVAQCDPLAAQTEETRAWIDDEPVGREAI